MKRAILPFLVLAALCAPAARAAEADVTGIVPTIWWDFETQPSATDLSTANKGSASGITFTSEGTKTYVAGVTNGWAVDTSKFTPYSGAGTCSTAGSAFTVSLVMTLGSTQNGITWNIRNATASKDLVIRRGATAGSLLVGVGTQAQASSDFLEATFADGDAAWHLVSVVVEPAAMSLYVDGVLEDSTTSFTLGSESGYVSQMQLGSHLNGTRSPEVKGGGLVDDFRIHDAALSPLQIRAIAAEYGFVQLENYIAVRSSGETTIGTTSFSAPFNLLLDEGDMAEAAIVYGTDSALSAPVTNVVGSALPAGPYAASLSGLASGMDYWWKIVASNGVNCAETSVASFHTLDVVVPAEYAKRIPIAVSGYAGTETLTNFPVLVTLAAGTPAGFDYADCADGGADLRFADANGVLAPHEIELWNTNGTSYVWVLARRLPPAGAVLALYYGADPARLPDVDPADVWSPYAVVIHGGSSLTNSVGNGIAVAAGSASVAADMDAGIAGGGVAKSANNAIGLNVANPSAKLADSGRFSVSGWFRRNGKGGKDNNGTHILAASRSDWSNEDGFLMLQEQGKYISVAYKGTHNWNSGSHALADRTWGHVAFAYDKTGSTLVSYFDGTLDNAKSGPGLLENAFVAEWTFGSYRNRATADSFKGEMDELRVYNGVASADWIRAEHDSVADPSSFAILSQAESTDVDEPRLGEVSASDANGTATFTVAIAVPGYGGEVPTSVSVFYGTNGVDWTELAIGSTNAVGTLTGSASGLTGNVRYLWYAVASATHGGATKTDTSVQRSFVANAAAPAGEYKSFTATVNWTGSPEQNIPVLLRVSETAINGFHYMDVTSSKFEILDSDGQLLPFEIDSWNTNGESLVWVLVRDYRDGATFTVRYGAPFSNVPVPSEEVWAGYKGVWHMDSVDPADSTANGFDGTHKTANLSVVSGAIGSAVNIPHSNSADGISCGNVLANSEIADGFTVGGWCRPTQYGDLGDGAAMFGKNAFISVRIKDSTHVIVTTPSVANHEMALASGVLPIVGEWWHFAVTFKMNTANDGLNLYLNGQLVKSMTANNISDKTSASEMFLGRNQWDNQSFKGDLDEMRLAAGIRSANEIAAEYHAMADNGALTCGPVESSDTTIPVIGTISAENGNGSATFSVALDRPGYGGAAPTSVSVFYGTDGENWTELSLGSTNEAATLTGSASGFAYGVSYVWYAVATATSGNVTRSITSAQRSFVARAFDPTGYYKSFTVTVVWNGSPAENVPFPIRISEAGIHGFDYGDVTSSGFEILDSGGQLLPYEIDTWNTNGESLVWTRLPVYENGATVTVRYGATFANAPRPAADVWKGYAGVWHMNETYDATTAATGLSHDSTTNHLDATPTNGGYGNLAQMVSGAGVLGNARVNATGNTMSGNYLSVPSYDSLALGDTFAVSGWFKATTVNGYPRLLSRKESYNSDNGWEIENANGADRQFSARGGSQTSITLNTPTYANDWIHIALVYDGTRLSAYANGEPCGSGTITAATDNGKPLSFGNNSNGSERSLPGLYDEIRLLDATPSAARIVAEYHAMVDVAVLSSVSSSDTSSPVLGVPSVVSNPDGSFTISVEVSENAPASIVCAAGGVTCTMTTADASLPATYTGNVSGLAPGTHTASVRATSTGGTSISTICLDAFHAGALAITKLSDADEGTLAPGVFRVSRQDADSTDLPALTFDVAFSGDGLAAVADPGITSATIPAGAAYVDISVTPVPTDEVNEDSELVLTVSGVHVGQSSSGTLTVVNADFDLAVRYVSPSGDDANSGGTPETAKRTIAAAVAAVNPVAPTRPCTVHVAPGRYPISAKISLSEAIRVIGDDPDPSHTFVSNTVGASYYTQDQRIFQLNHANALVANLTMQNGQEYGDGGDFFIGSNGGMVSNCVVETGYTRDNGKAGGGWLEAGIVTHTVFRRNRSNSGSVNWQGNRPGVLQLNGLARAENCLFTGNNQHASVTLINAYGSSVMRNCTIIDSSLAATNEACKAWSAINIASGATVQNVVIASVTNTVDGLPCPPTGAVSKFLNGAFDGDATVLPEGTVIGTAAQFFKDNARGDYRPKTGGPLVGAGANYEGMADVDLSGTRKRLVGRIIDIGAYEGSPEMTVLILK